MTIVIVYFVTALAYLVGGALTGGLAGELLRRAAVRGRR